jgi:hypothetical protein
MSQVFKAKFAEGRRKDRRKELTDKQSKGRKFDTGAPYTFSFATFASLLRDPCVKWPFDELSMGKRRFLPFHSSPFPIIKLNPAGHKPLRSNSLEKVLQSGGTGTDGWG